MVIGTVAMGRAVISSEAGTLFVRALGRPSDPPFFESKKPVTLNPLELSVYLNTSQPISHLVS